jgi:hypothetical protein
MLYLAKNYIGVRMKSELYVVPPQLVHKYWHMAEPHLKLAIEKGNGEFELNDLRYVCSRGEQQLLMVMRDDKCHCALTTIFYNFPKFRTCYISYIGGRNTKEGMEQFKNWANDSGCDRITGSAVTESVARLWSKLYGFEKKYITVEMKLNQEDKDAKE